MNDSQATTTPSPANEGLLLQLEGAEQLLAAARAARAAGLTPRDAFSPFGVDGLSVALGNPPSKIPWLMLACGGFGGLLAFGTMSWSAVVGYPFVVGGRPYFSWPAFVPITFELVVLSASLAGAFFLLRLCRLPRLHHPVFNDARYIEAMQHGFFLWLADEPEVREFLAREFQRGQWREVGA